MGASGSCSFKSTLVVVHTTNPAGDVSLVRVTCCIHLSCEISVHYPIKNLTGEVRSTGGQEFLVGPSVGEIGTGDGWATDHLILPLLLKGFQQVSSDPPHPSL